MEGNHETSQKENHARQLAVTAFIKKSKDKHTAYNYTTFTAHKLK